MLGRFWFQTKTIWIVGDYTRKGPMVIKTKGTPIHNNLDPWKQQLKHRGGSRLLHSTIHLPFQQPCVFVMLWTVTTVVKPLLGAQTSEPQAADFTGLIKWCHCSKMSVEVVWNKLCQPQKWFNILYNMCMYVCVDWSHQSRTWFYVPCTWWPTMLYSSVDSHEQLANNS